MSLNLPAPKDDRPWWRRALCFFGLHGRMVYSAGSFRCSDCWCPL